MGRKRDYDRATGNALGPEEDISNYSSYSEKYDPKTDDIIGKTNTGKSFMYTEVSGRGPEKGRQILPTMKAMKPANSGRQGTSKYAPSGRKPSPRGGY